MEKNEFRNQNERELPPELQTEECAPAIAALHESESNFRALAENANDGIVLIAGKGNFVYANRRFAAISGYSVSRLLKHGINKLVNPAERELMWQRFRKRLAGEKVPDNYETALIHKSGRTVPIEVTGSQTIWHGQPAVLIIIRDITRRWQMENALRENENNFRTLTENANDGILLAAGDGNNVYANKKFGEMTGYTVAELKKISFRELVHPDERQKIEARYYKRLADEDVPNRYEARLFRKDGIVIPVEVTASKTMW